MRMSQSPYSQRTTSSRVIGRRSLVIHRRRADLKSPPRVRVKVTFQNPKGQSATVERTLDGGKVTATIDPSFNVPSILLEAGLLMPARLAAASPG